MDLTIRLFRRNEIFDEIVFRKRMNETFLLKYVNGPSPRNVWVNEKTKEQLLEYIEATLFFFKLDAYPFEKIGICIPGRPQIFVNHSDFSDSVSDDIFYAIDDYLHNPPARYTL